VSPHFNVILFKIIYLYFLQESDKERLNKLTEELEHKTFDELFGDDILFGKINNF